MSVARFDAGSAAGLFRTLTAASLDGRGRFPGAVPTARRHVRRHREARPPDATDGVPTGTTGGGPVPGDDPTIPVDVERVTRDVVEQHVRLAGAQGFVTSLGGFAVLPLALPANITGLAVLQTRMVGAIAFLHGYDVADARVRTAIVACLFGEDAVGELVRTGRLTLPPHEIATAAEHDPALERRVAVLLGAALGTRVGGKRLGITVSRRVPLLGGGVGAVADAVSSYKVGRYAARELAATGTVALPAPAGDEAELDDAAHGADAITG